MPNLDQTGPQGKGTLTGRGFGPCAGNINGFGRGMRMCGFGRRRLTKEESIEMLEQEEKNLQTELNTIKEEKAELLKK